MERPKPCPFCRNEQIAIKESRWFIWGWNKDGSTTDGWSEWSYIIKCKNCKTEMHVFTGKTRSKIKVIKAWNRRDKPEDKVKKEDAIG